MKKSIKYILIYLITIFILLLALILVAKIPRKYVINNIIKSSEYTSKKEEINRNNSAYLMKWQHIYADDILLNIVYNIDTNTPLKSVMEAKYYMEVDSLGGLKAQIENGKKANKEYIRYWHGSIIFLTILLLKFSIQQIYIFMAIIMAMLTIILSILLIKKRKIILLISIIIASIMTGSIFVPFCLEYTWTYLIMLIVSIIIILKSDKINISILFFITGILTCFFDFLTTEILTILVPLIIYIEIEGFKEKKLSYILKFVIKNIMIWFVGYCITWGVKWGLASIVLKENALKYVMNKGLIRINPKFLYKYSIMENLIKTLKRNLFVLFPYNIIENKWIINGLLIFMSCFYAIFRNKNKMVWIYSLIAIMPYIRYMVLANHSYYHCFFTFRSQFVTIMCIVLVLGNCIDWKKIKNIKRNIKWKN